MFGLVAVEKKNLEYKYLRSKLRCIGDNSRETVYLDCWKDAKTHWLVPRQWALQEGLYLPEMVVENVEADWGAFNGTYRDGQEAAIIACHKGLLQHYGGRLEASVGSGKTLIGCDVASRLKTKTLVLVHKEDLLEQWQDTAWKLFGTKCGVIQQDRMETSHPMTVAMIQTLYSRLDSIKIWEDFGMVLGDENHRAPSMMFNEVLNRLNTRYRLGVSATWRRSDGLQDVWDLQIGQLFHTFKKLVTGVYYQIPKSGPFHDKKYRLYGGSNMNHTKYVTDISKNATHNLDIRGHIVRARDKGRKVLVVGERVEQLKKLQSQIKDSALYLGESTKKQMAEAKKAKVILGTRGKIGEGSDIDDLDTLILATPMGDVEQIVGRICREKSSKKSLLILDLFPNTPYNLALANKRRKIYEKMGFKSG